MSDSIADLLKKRSYDEPPEVAAIKAFIKDRYDSDSKVAVRENQIIIAVMSAGLAGTLRLQLPRLQKAANTDKRLVIRIG